MIQKKLENQQLIEGITAPELTLFDTDDKEHRLSDYRGKKSYCIFTLRIIHLVELAKQSFLEAMLCLWRG